MEADYYVNKIYPHDRVEPESQQIPPRIELCPVLGRMACVGTSIQAKNFANKKLFTFLN